MRLGVLGGTFDPPHLGHLKIAHAALEQLRLDRLLLVPASVPSHKIAVTPAAIRLAMLIAATADDPRIEVSTIELDREGPSYTVGTIRELRQIHGAGVEIHLLLGADWIEGFPYWKEPAEILRLAKIAIFPRDKIVCDPEWPHILLQTPEVDISSTQVRERVSEGMGIEDLVPESVRVIIQHARLYRDDPFPARP